ncbi:hypothetical protein [Pseudomonas syringae]|nr:hypothetical protein [Pseudomonas syringae]
MRATYQLDNSELGLVLGVLGLGIAISEIPWASDHGLVQRG